jgi:serine/threonine-protein kinase
MAEVYRATDSVLERPVAVKLLSERHARDTELRARFEREALAASRLSGAAHVITIFDVGEHDHRPLIVMEYLEGGTVYDRLARGGVSHEQALQWLEQIAGALDKAHAHGIVHRDVKPANLLLDRDDSIHVSDFGIAFAAGLDTLTLPGTVLGTAGYLSPEQARGEPATSASDRYALGVVAFELLTGRRPFAADTPVSEALGHMSAPVPSAEQLEPELPAGVDRVLSRALAKDPGKRPASCTELVAELRVVFQTVPATIVVDTDASTRRMRVHTTRPRLRLAAVSGLVGALVAGLMAELRAAFRAVPAPTRVDTDGPTRRMGVPTTLPWRRLGLVALVVAGLVLAALVGIARDEGGLRQAQSRKPTSAASPVATRSPASVDGAALNDAGFEKMQAGEYEQALPILRQAVASLAGSGSLTSAYASYNLAFTRFVLGRCDGVMGLLDRADVVDRDVGAGLGQPFGARPADAPRSARDQRHFSREINHDGVAEMTVV